MNLEGINFCFNLVLWTYCPECMNNMRAEYDVGTGQSGTIHFKCKCGYVSSVMFKCGDDVRLDS